MTRPAPLTPWNVTAEPGIQSMNKSTPEPVVVSEPRCAGKPIRKLSDAMLISASFRAALRDEYSFETLACLREILERRLISCGKLRGLTKYELKPMARVVSEVMGEAGPLDASVRLEALYVQRELLDRMSRRDWLRLG